MNIGYIVFMLFFVNCAWGMDSKKKREGAFDGTVIGQRLVRQDSESDLPPRPHTPMPGMRRTRSQSMGQMYDDGTSDPLMRRSGSAEKILWVATGKSKGGRSAVRRMVETELAQAVAQGGCTADTEEENSGSC